MTPGDAGTSPSAARGWGVVIWLPGLAVAAGAAAATAHGLYEVAAAAGVPAGLAWLYPLITDGLALVAYAATAQLTGSAARYAWTVVITAAGLSGLAQATYLAAGTSPGDAPAVGEVSGLVRFGIGAWPAVAAAVVAHLLYLLATDPTPDRIPFRASRGDPDPGDPSAVHPGAADPGHVQPVVEQAVEQAGPVQPALFSAAPEPAASTVPGDPGEPAGAPSPARDRAAGAAVRHAHRYGGWPTVSELEAAASVSRGTAAAVLKHLRAGPVPLHLITDSPDGPAERGPTPGPTEPRTQP